jgi:hypothetical protein
MFLQINRGERTMAGKLQKISIDKLCPANKTDACGRFYDYCNPQRLTFFLDNNFKNSNIFKTHTVRFWPPLHVSDHRRPI